MRNLDKTCGLSVHQGRGPSLKEYQLKDKKIKTKHPPTDFYGRSFVGVTQQQFSLFVWYQKQQDNDPDVACVDVQVDGRYSRGWTLKSGRENGIMIDSIQSKPLEFNSKKERIQGVIQATFWRVMDNGSNEYFADEGVPAIAVLTLFYRDIQTLTNMNVIKKKRMFSELSTQLSSPHCVRTVSFAELEQDLDVDKENFVPMPKKFCIERDVTSDFEMDLDLDDKQSLDTTSPLEIRKELGSGFQNNLTEETSVTSLAECDGVGASSVGVQQVNVFATEPQHVNKSLPFRRRIPVHFQDVLYRITVDTDNTHESITEKVRLLCQGRMEFEYDDGILTDIRVF